MKSKLYLLDQVKARRLDVELMGEKYKYTLEQLMELAGLSVASAVTKRYDRKVPSSRCVGPREQWRGRVGGSSAPQDVRVPGGARVLPKVP